MLAGKARLRRDVGTGWKAVKFPLSHVFRSTAPARRIRSTRMTNDPFPQFDAWFAEARASEPNDANAMALATTTAAGHPSLRMVLLKGHGPDGFIFYTNLDSRKGGELLANPHAALLFHWKSLRRQIRIEGPVTPVDDATADAYFATRSRDSGRGAWASAQSRPLPERRIFEQRFAEVEKLFADKPVPRPPHWSGFRVTPQRIEFWEDRDHRLHHRRPPPGPTMRCCRRSARRTISPRPPSSCRSTATRRITSCAGSRPRSKWQCAAMPRSPRATTCSNRALPVTPRV